MLLQLRSDFESVGYSLEDPRIFGMNREYPVEYLIVHKSQVLPVGRLWREGVSYMKYEPWGYGDAVLDYYAAEAHEIALSRLRLVHVE